MSTGGLVVGYVVGGLLALLLIAVLVWGWKESARKHKYFTAHPEQAPNRQQMLRRNGPFVALGVVGLLWGLLSQRPDIITMGALATIGGGLLLWQGWRHPWRDDD